MNCFLSLKKKIVLDCAQFNENCLKEPWSCRLEWFGQLIVWDNNQDHALISVDTSDKIFLDLGV